MSENIHNFINYLDEPVSDEFVSKFYEVYNIKHDRVKLFKDFSSSLSSLMVDTYMGDEITDKTQKKKHFDWCYNKNLSNFKEEGILFGGEILYEYFQRLLHDIYYTNKKNKSINDSIIRLWDVLFSFNQTKSAADLEMFLLLYNLMEKSLLPLDNVQ